MVTSSAEYKYQIPDLLIWQIPGSKTLHSQRQDYITVHINMKAIYEYENDIIRNFLLNLNYSILFLTQRDLHFIKNLHRY